MAEFFYYKKQQLKRTTAMTTILSLTGNFVTTKITNIVSILVGGKNDTSELDEIARESNALKRQRGSFTFSRFIRSAVSMIGASPLHEQSYHLENFRERYNDFDDDKKNISNKGFHKRLAVDDSTEYAAIIANQAMYSVNKKFKKNAKKLVSSEEQKLLKILNVEDINLIDGSVITLRKGAAGKFPNKGAGRNKNTGESAAPAIKIHAMFSFVRQQFEYIDITEAVEDERKHVSIESLKGKALIADRGYVSEKLEHDLIQAEIPFIIKGKKNMTTGTIIAAYGEDGSELEEYKGMQYGDINKNSKEKILDVILKNSKGDEFRICRRLNPNQNSTRNSADESQSTGAYDVDSDKYIYLRTNIKRKTLNIEKLFMAYRLRWRLEFFFEQLKQGECMRSINSSDKNIILIFVLLSIISALIKLFLTINAALKGNKKLIELSYLKIHNKTHLFAKLYSVIGRARQSKIYEVMDEVEKLILKYCLRSRVSKPNKEKGKDYLTLIADLIKDDSSENETA